MNLILQVCKYQTGSGCVTDISMQLTDSCNIQYAIKWNTVHYINNNKKQIIKTFHKQTI